MTACCCSACSLKDILVRELKLALVQHHVHISSLLPAIGNTCSVHGWKVSALCCVVHMHAHPTAWVEAKETKLSFMDSQLRQGKRKMKAKATRSLSQIIALSFMWKDFCAENKRQKKKKSSDLAGHDSNCWRWMKERETTSLLSPQMPQRAGNRLQHLPVLPSRSSERYSSSSGQKSVSALCQWIGKGILWWREGKEEVYICLSTLCWRGKYQLCQQVLASPF